MSKKSRSSNNPQQVKHQPTSALNYLNNPKRNRNQRSGNTGTQPPVVVGGAGGVAAGVVGVGVGSDRDVRKTCDVVVQTDESSFPAVVVGFDEEYGRRLRQLGLLIVGGGVGMGKGIGVDGEYERRLACLEKILE